MPFSLELQRDIEKLLGNVSEIEKHLSALNESVEKFEALCNLYNYTLSDSSISNKSPASNISCQIIHDRSSQLKTLKMILKCYEDQTQLNRTISENIGVASSLDQTVYYVCIWTHQPAIEQQCFVTESQLANMLQN